MRLRRILRDDGVEDGFGLVNWAQRHVHKWDLACAILSYNRPSICAIAARACAVMVKKND